MIHSNTLKILISTSFSLFLSIALLGQSSSNYAGKAFDNDGSNTKFTTVQNTALQDAYLNLPEGIAIDTSGKTYFTHWHRVMIIDGGALRGRAGGAGNPTSTSGEDYDAGIVGRFNQPRGVAVHPLTNEVYICDYGNRKIRKLSRFNDVSNAQTGSRVAGTGVSGNVDGDALTTAQFEAPYDIVAMANGDFYISDDYQHTIRKLSGGMVTTVAGNAGTSGDNDATGTAALFADPMGMCKMDESNILICDYNNGKIRKLNVTTNVVTTVVSGLFGPRDVEYVNGVIYITQGREIKKYENSTLTTYCGSNAVLPDSTFGTLAQTMFGSLRNIVYNKKENALYVVDNQFGVIKRIILDNGPIIDFDATPRSASVNQVVKLTDLTTNKLGTKIWKITPNNYNLINGSTLTSENPQVEFTQTGSYTIELTYTYATGTISKEKIAFINVSNITAVPVTNFSADKVNVGPNNNVVFTDLSSNTPTTWLWEVTPSTGVTYKNSTSSSSRFPVMSFANEGKYTVKLTATNASGGNATTKTDYITVDNQLATKQIVQLPVYAYPNPVSDILYVNGLETNETYNFMLLNIVGQSTLSGILNANHSINLNDLKSGSYILIISNANGQTINTKIVKE